MNGFTVEQFKGTIYEQGFGMISRKIMKDRSINLQAKAVYSYLASHSFGGNKVTTKQTIMMADLGISEKTLRTHMKLLKDNGYVVVEKYLIPKKDRTNPKQRYRNHYVLSNSLLDVKNNVKTREKSIKQTDFEPVVFGRVQSEPIQNDRVNNKKRFIIKKGYNKKLKETSFKYSSLEILKEFKGITKSNISRYIETTDEMILSNAKYILENKDKFDNIDKVLYSSLKKNIRYNSNEVAKKKEKESIDIKKENVNTDLLENLGMVKTAEPVAVDKKQIIINKHLKANRFMLDVKALRKLNIELKEKGFDTVELGAM